MVDKTQTFGLVKAEVQINMYSKSEEYELVEVINSSNFVLTDKSTYHNIKVNGELAVHCIQEKNKV